MWLNGVPEMIAVKLVIKIEESPYIIRQGLPFNVRVECHTANGDVVEGEMVKVYWIFKSPFQHISGHIRIVPACNRGYVNHFISAVSLKYHTAGTVV